MVHSLLPKKKFRVNYNQPSALIFLPPYQITFFLVFDQAHALTSHFDENS